MKKIKKLLLLFILPLLLISCDRKPVLEYKDACVHPDALKEIKYYVKHKIADAEGLLIAAEKNTNEKIVKELLKSKNIDSDAKNAALLKSLYNKNPEILKVLLKSGADVNAKDEDSGETLLHLLCQEDKPNKELVATLIKAKADVNARDDTGMTPLIFACMHGDLELINMLIKAKADVNAQDEMGMTPLLAVCHNPEPNVDIIAVLTRAGADVNAADEDGITPLMVACTKGDKALVDALIAAKADVNAVVTKEVDGVTEKVTILMMVLSLNEKPDVGIVNSLIAAGADVNAESVVGGTSFTALVLACELENKEIIDALLKAGADIKKVYEIYGINMVSIPGENFEMLSTEVTQKTYSMVMGKNPSYFKGDNRPVEQVSLYDAVEFCNALSKKLGLSPAYTINGTKFTYNASANGFRLPTEGEWESAAKGGGGIYLCWKQ